MPRLDWSLTALAALVLLTGCGSDVGTDSAPPPVLLSTATSTKKPPSIPESTAAPIDLPRPTESVPPTEPSDTETDSGIEGQVLIGPMCPVMREDQPCPDQPYQAVITILAENGTEIGRVQSDALGHFRVDLAPGTYTLRPEPGEGIAWADEQNVSVGEGQFTQVIVSYDSGIR